jgi:peptide/nickel transport system substrate-binding protein
MAKTQLTAWPHAGRTAAAIVGLPLCALCWPLLLLLLLQFPPRHLRIVVIVMTFWLCALRTQAIEKDNLAASSDRPIVFGGAWEPLGFNPLRALDSGSYSAQTLVYEGLVRYNSQMDIVAAAASSYSVSADGLTYTFDLREGMRFSDGSAVTLQDVLASIALAQAPSSPYKADFACIKKCEQSGEKQVVLRLDEANGPLLARLTDLRILPNRIVSAADHGNAVLNTDPVGTGPFRLVRWQSGLELVFARNEYYWDGNAGRNGLVWRIVPDKSLLAMAMQRGELDVASVDAATWAHMSNSRKDNSHLVLEQLAGARTVYLGFNLRRKPFDNPQVRRALGQAINRKRLIDRFYGGYACAPLTDVPSGSWAYSSDVQKLAYNPTQARQLLESQGYKLSQNSWRKNEKMLAVRIVTVRDLEDIAQVVADDLVRMQIPCEVQVMEYATLRGRYLRTGDFDAVLWSRSAGPDPECSLVWKSKGALNFCGFSQAGVDQLLDRGRLSRSRAERVRIYRDLQKVLAEQLPWIFLAQPEMLLVHTDQIDHVKSGRETLGGTPWDNPVFDARYWSARH